MQRAKPIANILRAPRSQREHRQAHLVELLDTTRPILEIGPFANPLLPKASFPSVSILDVAPTEELRQRAVDLGEDETAIDHVDFVAPAGLSADVAGDHRFGHVVACSVLEHIPDPIGFLGECANILEPGGTVALSIPDMRYCFDVLREPSSLGELVDAWTEGRTRTTIGQVVDHLCGATMLDGSIQWSPGSTGSLKPVHQFEDAIIRLRSAADAKADAPHEPAVHMWKFTPDHFVKIFHGLRQLELTELDIMSISSGSQEFYVHLAVSESPGPCRRIELGLKAKRTANARFELLRRLSRLRGVFSP